MPRKKPKFRKGQVVAFKKRGEILFCYGKLDMDLGTIWDHRGIPEKGWRIVAGNNFYEIAINAIRSLTAKEAETER